MAEIALTQAEADSLIGMKKHRVDDTEWQYPGTGGELRIPLTSADRREAFVLDVHRGHVDLAKGTYQNRGRQVIVLVRLDFGAAPHRNPDGEDVACPHLHVYREGYGDKWAVPLPGEAFSNRTDRWTMLQDFLRYCNVVEPPAISKGLFP